MSLCLLLMTNVNNYLASHYNASRTQFTYHTHTLLHTIYPITHLPLPITDKQTIIQVINNNPKMLALNVQKAIIFIYNTQLYS